jgi:hypothetical protein
VFRHKLNGGEVECLICPKVGGQYASVLNRHIERHQTYKPHQRAMRRLKSFQSNSLKIHSHPATDLNHDIEDSEETFSADAPVNSEMLEEDICGAPASPFQDESHSEGSDDESLIPLHLLWDPSKSAALCPDFEFLYNPSDLRELEDDGDGGVHETDDEVDRIDLSGG